jgi:diguanylate cyclase (GGDEF)-like protein/PAS domain S-box-containing protein
MGVHFVPGGHDALYRLWAGASQEIALACDAKGRVSEASAAIARLGWRDGAGLIGRPLWDLATGSAQEPMRAAFERAIRRGRRSNWVEVTLAGRDGSPLWYELRLEPLVMGPGHLLGAVCLLRPIDERRRLERQAFAAAMTDQLTGLTNRTAFVAMLDHLAQEQVQGWLLLTDLDRFRAINLRHGHAAGDRLLASFADLLRRLTQPQHILSRIDGETFAILLPGEAETAARAIGEAIRTALDEVAEGAMPGELPFTASIGLAPLGPNSDAALREAELAVTEAKARGRARLASSPARLRLPWRWSAPASRA